MLYFSNFRGAKMKGQPRLNRTCDICTVDGRRKSRGTQYFKKINTAVVDFTT